MLILDPQAFLQWLHPDFTLDEVSLQANGNMVYRELKLHGTHRGSLNLPGGAAIPATDARVCIPIGVYHTFDERGNFVSSRIYIDLHDLISKLGMGDLLKSS